MSTPCSACRSDASPRTLEKPGPAGALVARELGSGARIIHAVGSESPPPGSPHDRSLNPDLSISYGEAGSWSYSSRPYEAIDWFAYVRCGACARVWRVRTLRRLVERVTKDSGAPNYDAIEFAYDCDGSEARLELVNDRQAACVEAATVAQFAAALKERLFPFEALWRPLLEALQAADPEGLATFFETTRRGDLPWQLRDLLAEWMKTQPGRATPNFELTKVGRFSSNSRPCPAVALGDAGFAWISTTNDDHEVWHVLDLATKKLKKRRLALDGLSVNHRVFPEWNAPYAAVYLQDGAMWGMPSGFALVTPDGEVALVRSGIEWTERDGRHNARVTVAGDQVLVPEGRKIVSLDIATNEPAFVVDGLPDVADGRVSFRDDLLVFGLFGGLATWKPEGKVTPYVRKKKLLLCELDGLVVGEDGVIERLFEGTKAQAALGNHVAAHRTDRHLALVGHEGVEVFDPGTLAKIGEWRCGIDELHGSGLTMGVTAVLGEELVLVDPTGRVVTQRGLDEEPHGLVTMPGFGFALLECDLDSKCPVTFLACDGRVRGATRLAFDRELLFNDARTVALLEDSGVVRVGTIA